MKMLPIQKILVGTGLLLILAGLLIPLLKKWHIGHLPGDILIKRENFSFYFPITTTLLISALLSFLFWIFKK